MALKVPHGAGAKNLGKWFVLSVAYTKEKPSLRGGFGVCGGASILTGAYVRAHARIRTFQGISVGLGHRRGPPA